MSTNVTLLNVTYAGKTLTTTHGRAYTVASDGTVVVAVQDVQFFLDLGFYRTSPDAPTFFSIEIPLSTTGLQTVAHNLGGTPFKVWTNVKCTDAGGEGGYAQNERIPMHLCPAGSPDIPFSYDGTNIYINLQGAGLGAVAKAGGSSFSFTTSKWSLELFAML